MIHPSWKFRIMDHAEINQDPIEGEFFTTQDVGDFSDALVRECIQNSLDARSDSDRQVTVRFYISGKAKANNTAMRSNVFFEGLEAHLKAKHNGLDEKEIKNLSDNIPFIAVEDFNTTGLDGSVTENNDPENRLSTGHNFYWFWRNVGRTGKIGTERGKWGLGKTVFPASSKINTFLGLTQRADDGKEFLMGLSVLKLHYLEGRPSEKRQPYGYFGKFETTESEYFATPVDDENILNSFRESFHLKRNKYSDPGLSVVIPYPKDEINYISVIQSALRQYFYPILSGALRIEVTDADSNKELIIDSDTISSHIDDLGMTYDFGKLFKLCTWSLNLREEDFVVLNTPPQDSPAQWRAEWLINGDTEEIIDKKKDVFDVNGPVAFMIPVWVKITDHSPVKSYFKLFIVKDSELDKPDVHFVRNGITITGEGNRVGKKTVRAIVLIEDGALANLLGDAENPAHTEWQKNSSKFRGKYNDGDRVISFIQRSVDKIYEYLLKPAEGLDNEILGDVFYIELEDDNNVINPADEGKKVNPDRTGIPAIISERTPFSLESKQGGFIVRNNAEKKSFTGRINVKVAYLVGRGNSLKKYEPYDFDMTKEDLISVRTHGVDDIIRGQNELTFKVSSGDDFSVVVEGFDDERDLFVKADYHD